MVERTGLVFGTAVYTTDDITEDDVRDNYGENVLVEKGVTGKFIAYTTDEDRGELSIVFFEPDIVLAVSKVFIDVGEIPTEKTYACFVCGTRNTLEQALVGCKSCGVSFDPINGDVGGGETEESDNIF